MARADWWEHDAKERFWLEATDRTDLGIDLRAPLVDESGNENWRYTLFRRARVGDVVLHYDKRPAVSGIVGYSIVAGPAYEHEIVWAARGTYARAKGVTPHTRSGYRVPLEGFVELQAPVTLDAIRQDRDRIASVLSALETSKGPLYFPFELSGKRAVRLLQGYAFKVPRAFLTLFPQLGPVVHLADSTPVGERVTAPSIADDEAIKNPAWSRDELILALDLYMRNRASPPSKTSREVADLSDLLNRMGRSLGRTGSATFRNSNGVYMKMMNFRRLDPAFTGEGRVGLTRGGKDEAVVWQEFTADLDRLRSVAGAIRTAVDAQQPELGVTSDNEEGLEEAPEGRVLTRLHRYRERDRRLVEASKRRAMKAHGRLHCQACGFDFGQKYGKTGEGIIECHHIRPVHTLTENATTQVADLVLLCANCHRVVHSHRPWLTLDELRRAIGT